MDFDTTVTSSSAQQRSLESKVANLTSRASDNHEKPLLDKEGHITYLQKGLASLPQSFTSLESSRPWLLYWIIHSLALLQADLPQDVSLEDIAEFLTASQYKSGGIGGSPGHIPHLATTYAGVAAAIDVGHEAYTVLDRLAIYRFLLKRCMPASAGGGFEVCQGGEVDVRGCYTALATAHMLALDKQVLAKQSDMVQYVVRCQTYEGGLGGEPGNEAHGGYTFCGLAALCLIGEAHRLDLPALLHFAVSCQGALLPLLQQLGPEILEQTGLPVSLSDPLIDTPSQQIVVPSYPSRQPGNLLQQAQDAVTRAQAALDIKVLQLEQVRQQRRPEVVEKAALSSVAKAQVLVEAAEERVEVLKQSCSKDVLRPEPQSEARSSDRCVQSGEECPYIEGDVKLENFQQLELYDREALQRWILLCCQAPNGGLRDKPGKPPDYYHTCYCLSGLSASQHFGPTRDSHLEDPSLLAKTDLLCNVVEDKLNAALAYFSTQK